MTRRGKDAVESRFHEIKHTIMEDAGPPDTNWAIDVRSTDEQPTGKTRQLIGRFENFLSE